MRAIVLGAAAGGWPAAVELRVRELSAGSLGEIPAASQSSLAVSGNGRDWAILNASPDLRAQVAACAALHPTGARESPVRRCC